jgi:hypothetical protein
MLSACKRSYFRQLILDVWTSDGITVNAAMPRRRKGTFWIEEHQAEGLKGSRSAISVLESEQIRRAIDRWLDDKGIRRRRAAAP